MLLVLLNFSLLIRNLLFQVVSLLRKSLQFFVSVFATLLLHLLVNFVKQMKLTKDGLHVRVDGIIGARVCWLLAISKRRQDVLHPVFVRLAVAEDA